MVETHALARQNGAPSPAVAEQVLIAGDLSELSPQQRSEYYLRVCDSLGLNPLTKPFEYLKLSGRLVLYARKDATDQLRAIRNVSVALAGQEATGDLYVVRARATLPSGRTDEEMGAVAIAGLRGEALANAMMKATTKAKRRVTLSICGLGMLDESEVDSIPDAVRVEVEQPAGETTRAPAGPDRSGVPVPAESPCQPAPDPNTAEGVQAAFDAEPQAHRDDPAWRRYRALVEAAQKAGVGFTELTVEAPDAVLEDEGKRIQRALVAKREAR